MMWSNGSFFGGNKRPRILSQTLLEEPKRKVLGRLEEGLE